ncbi:hypothetical protein D3C72_1944190 [compost metagenome]
MQAHHATGEVVGQQQLGRAIGVHAQPGAVAPTGIPHAQRGVQGESSAAVFKGTQAAALDTAAVEDEQTRGAAASVVVARILADLHTYHAAIVQHLQPLRADAVGMQRGVPLQQQPARHAREHQKQGGQCGNQVLQTAQ